MSLTRPAKEKKNKTKQPASSSVPSSERLFSEHAPPAFTQLESLLLDAKRTPLRKNRGNSEKGETSDPRLNASAVMAPPNTGTPVAPQNVRSNMSLDSGDRDARPPETPRRFARTERDVFLIRGSRTSGHARIRCQQRDSARAQTSPSSFPFSFFDSLPPQPRGAS